MGFGPRFINAIKSTYSHQSGRICLNGWIGESFPLRSGVRQGNPLAPSIFALILEPLAASLRARLRGIPRILSPFPFKMSAFADDLGAGCRDYKDVETLDISLREFEKAAAMIVNRSKSFLYPLGTFATDPPPTFGTWSITTEPFTALGVRIGRDVNVAEVWNEKVKKVKRRLSSIPFHDLPLASRCSIINIYCYSMIIYLDRFLPCPSAILDQLHHAAMKAIWRNSTSTVSEHRIVTPQVHGGFGLISLKSRLAGPRADWIFRLLTIPPSFQAVAAAIRGRLVKELLLRPRVQKRWDPAQLVQVPSLPLQWIALFFQPGSFVAGWPTATATLRHLLPSRWKDYLDAWNSIITLTTIARENWPTIALRPRPIHTAPVSTKHFVGPDGEKVSGDIGKDSRRILLKKFKLITPPGWASKFPLISAEEWEGWWTKLKTISRHSPEDVDLSHRLSLYCLHPGSQVSQPHSQFINNRSLSCILCLDPTSTETFQHLLVDCQVARRIWSLASPRNHPPLPHPSLQTLICPAPIPPIPILLQNILFLGRVWKLSRRRRWGKKDEEVGEMSELEVMKAVKGIWIGMAGMEVETGRRKVRRNVGDEG